MANTAIDKIIAIKAEQKEYFHKGETLNIRFRKLMLEKLLCALES